MGEVMKVTRRRLTVKDRLAEIDAQVAKHNAALVKLAEKRAGIVAEAKRQAAELVLQVEG